MLEQNRSFNKKEREVRVVVWFLGVPVSLNNTWLKKGNQDVQNLRGCNGRSFDYVLDFGSFFLFQV